MTAHILLPIYMEAVRCGATARQGTGDNQVSRGSDSTATSRSVTTPVNSTSDAQHHNAAPTTTVNCTVGKLECHAFTKVCLGVIAVE